MGRSPFGLCPPVLFHSFYLWHSNLSLPCISTEATLYFIPSNEYLILAHLFVCPPVISRLLRKRPLFRSVTPVACVHTQWQLCKRLFTKYAKVFTLPSSQSILHIATFPLAKINLTRSHWLSLEKLRFSRAEGQTFQSGPNSSPLWLMPWVLHLLYIHHFPHIFRPVLNLHPGHGFCYRIFPPLKISYFSGPAQKSPLLICF